MISLTRLAPFCVSTAPGSDQHAEELTDFQSLEGKLDQALQLLTTLTHKAE